jgi:hypothetical protein
VAANFKPGNRLLKFSFVIVIHKFKNLANLLFYLALF